jgi:hypothetical protein
VPTAHSFLIAAATTAVTVRLEADPVISVGLVALGLTRRTRGTEEDRSSISTRS